MKLIIILERFQMKNSFNQSLVNKHDQDENITNNILVV